VSEQVEQRAEDGALPEARLLRPWQIRAGRAEVVMDAFQSFLRADDEFNDEEATRFLASVNPLSHVGARHHTVPRFLLERWADKSSQVQTYSRIEEQFRTRNIRDLAIKDFYTFVDLEGRKDSSMEVILGEGVERPAAAVLRDLLNPFVAPRPADVSDLAALAQFAAFQVVRTARHRREGELHAEWYAKTVVEGRISDAELREIVVTPHQNDSIRMMGDAAFRFMALFACRPVALVLLDRPRLLIGDDPVLVNPGPKDDTHVADCFQTDAQISARMARERRKKKGRRRRQEGRIVHFSSTVPRGLGVALEIVLPVTPRAALLWGPLHDTPYVGDIVRERLDEAESEWFANLANDAICLQALDWVASTPIDEQFVDRVFPPVGPLMRVCDGVNAASVALNETPQRLRPARLWSTETD
jgi:hypothetical protein